MFNKLKSYRDSLFQSPLNVFCFLNPSTSPREVLAHKQGLMVLFTWEFVELAKMHYSALLFSLESILGIGRKTATILLVVSGGSGNIRVGLPILHSLLKSMPIIFVLLRQTPSVIYSIPLYNSH